MRIPVSYSDDINLPVTLSCTEKTQSATKSYSKRKIKRDSCFGVVEIHKNQINQTNHHSDKLFK